MESNIWANLWKDLKKGNNIDLYLLIPIILIVFALNLFSTIGGKAVLSIGMATLFVVTTNLLFFRHKIHSILSILKKEYINESYISQFPEEQFNKDIAESKSLTIIGTHINSFLTSHYDLLKDKARKGDKMRFILVTPYGDASKMAIMRFSAKKKDINIETQKIIDGLDNLTIVKEEASDNNVEIKTIDFLLDYTGYIIDNKIAYIEHHTFKISGGDMKPKSIYHRSRTANNWFNHIHNEVEQYWIYSSTYKQD